MNDESQGGVAGPESSRLPADRTLVGRQPILDGTGRLYGYELLYRRTAMLDDSDAMTRSVIADVITAFDIDTLSNNRSLFINATAEALTKGYVRLLPPERTVVEMLETVRIDDRVLAACRDLRRLGYRLALDDVTELEPVRHALDFVDIIKVDILDVGERELERIIQGARFSGCALLAEKVEDHETVRRCRDLGFTLFQGYYYCKPTRIAGSGVTASRLSFLQLLRDLARDDHDFNSLERTMQRDPTLCYQFLKMVNASFYGFRHRINGIKHALVLMGVNEVRRWALLLSLTAATANQPQELMRQALTRAKFCESRAIRLGGLQPADGFLAGLFSILDSATGMDMRDIVAPLPIDDEIKQALCGGEGPVRQILNEVVQAELDPTALAEDAVIINEAYLQALRWADKMLDVCLADDEEEPGS